MDDECEYGMPRWALFVTTVRREKFGFDLRNVAECFAYRRAHDIEPVYINPITMKPFHQRTCANILSRLDTLVDRGLLPTELRVGWN